MERDTNNKVVQKQNKPNHGFISLVSLVFLRTKSENSTGSKTKISQAQEKAKRIQGLNIQDIKAFIIATIGLFDSLIVRYSIWIEPDEKFMTGYYKSHPVELQEIHKRTHRRIAQFVMIFSLIAYPFCMIAMFFESIKWHFGITWSLFIIILDIMRAALPNYRG